MSKFTPSNAKPIWSYNGIKLICCLSLIVGTIVILVLSRPQATANAVMAQSTPGPFPTVIAYILTDADLTRELDEAEKRERLTQGLPIPATSVELPIETIEKATLDVAKNSLSPYASESISGWHTLFREEFEAGAPITNINGCAVRSTDSRYQWGQDDLRARDSTFAAWPAAGGDIGVDPAEASYPIDLITQLICTFTDVGSLQNVMTEFAIWQDAADLDDRFFVGFHTGELGKNGTRLFQGFEWAQAHIDENLGEPVWESRRIYYPDAATNLAQHNSDEIAVMWQFRSDGIQQPDHQGVWLDNLSVARYDEPVTSQNCRTLDPVVALPERPSNHLVSKGLNLPPYVEDDLDERIERIVAMGVNWVRLEFVVQPDYLIAGYTDGEVALRSLDLYYYDNLIDALCAHGIATLGLIDYQTLLRNDWQQNDTINDAYLSDFLAMTDMLVQHYRNRIGHWEIWNEPDYSGSRLEPGAYADLLFASYDTIKAIDPDAQVLFGGLASADANAHRYLRDFYAALAEQYPGHPTPFDIFAIHPYYSTLYRDSTNRLLVDPNLYLKAESPTIIAKFVDTLAGANPAGYDDSKKPIWVTELGWNSAKEASVPVGCEWLHEHLVTRREQATFLTDSFDLLLTDVLRQDNQPAISKIFWYQYRDTAIVGNCSGLRGAPLARLTAADVATAPHSRLTQVINWWFGLVDGTFTSKDAATAFQEYGEPIATMTPTPTVTSTPLPTATSALMPTVTATSTLVPAVTPTPTFVPTALPPTTQVRKIYLPIVQR